MDIPQEHLRGDHAHVRLWTRFYGRAWVVGRYKAVYPGLRFDLLKPVPSVNDCKYECYLKWLSVKSPVFSFLKCQIRFLQCMTKQV